MLAFARKSLILLVLAAPATAQEATLYGWRLMVYDHDGASYARGADLFGGRVVASLPLRAGLHLGLRGDAAALSDGLDAGDPSTYRLVRSLEGYAALSRPWPLGPVTAGPAVMAGTLVPVSTEATWAQRPVLGGGLRVARGRSWLYVLAGSHRAADERATVGAPSVRLLVAGSIEYGRGALVADYVSGPGGFARAGLAVRLPVPFGAQP